MLSGLNRYMKLPVWQMEMISYLAQQTEFLQELKILAWSYTQSMCLQVSVHVHTICLKFVLLCELFNIW